MAGSPPVSRPASAVARDHLVRALVADLVGPFQPDGRETLPLAPTRWYLTGFLVPQEAREAEEVEEDELGSGDEEDDEGEGTREPEPKRANRLPASFGISVLLPMGATSVVASLSYGEYRKQPPPEKLPEEAKPAEGAAMPASRPALALEEKWERVAKTPIVETLSLDAAELAKGRVLPGTGGIELVGTLGDAHAPGLADGTRALSLFVVNRRTPEQGKKDEAAIFQVELTLHLEAGFVARPNWRDRDANDFDERNADLHFRNVCEYAVGHGVAAEVAESGKDNAVVAVRTAWLPKAVVAPVVTREIPDVVTSMEALAEISEGAPIRGALSGVVDAYGAWIQSQRSIDLTTSNASTTARRNDQRSALLLRAERAKERIREGIELVAKGGDALEAFRMANRAMAVAARQRSPERYVDGKSVPTWRLFQLAFVLLNLPSIVDPKHDDRETVELIFFPTGGGKTEAYLGVIAFTLLLRRLRGEKVPHKGLGVAVLLRYTLRLLTLDQLARAATLVCALEMLRKKEPRLGSVRFSVGLWVGRSATANTIDEVRKRINDWKFRAGQGGSPFPLTNCPWCGAAITTDSLNLSPATSPTEVIAACADWKCDFAAQKNIDGLPVVFVDEQIYRELPSFLLATVDKFAILPWRGETGMLFGRATGREGRRFLGPLDPKTVSTKAETLADGLLPPELIVQDELHLISGPLGTMVGLYESAVEALCTTTDGVRPKLIASTATVRRAGAQTQALFGRRELDIFPPPGVDDGETFFARVDREGEGRLYLGVAAGGRALKGVLLRTYQALLGGGWRAAGSDPAAGDPYTTLAGYFNSLRELGGMRRLVEDVVRAHAAKLEDRRPVGVTGAHPWVRNREVGEVLELTSREKTNDIAKAKTRLGVSHTSDGHADVLLASNMISVGVDIERLGLMVVAGQPKSTAEYIQASSRVGRDPKRPGLVVTVFNLHKPRDRSHYERFENYHQSFYRFVEATSVTPFSGPALERGLAGVLIAIARLSETQLTRPEAVMDIDAQRAAGDAAVALLAERAGRAQRGLTEPERQIVLEGLRARGKNVLDAWASIVRKVRQDGSGDRSYSPWDRHAKGKSLLFQILDTSNPRDDDEKKFSAPSSMRDVEPSVHVWVQRGSLIGADRG